MPIEILHDVEVSLATPQGATLVRSFKAGILSTVKDELEPFIEHLLRTGHAVAVKAEGELSAVVTKVEDKLNPPAPESAPAPVEPSAPSVAPEPSQEQ